MSRCSFEPAISKKEVVLRFTNSLEEANLLSSCNARPSTYDSDAPARDSISAKRTPAISTHKEAIFSFLAGVFRVV